MRDVRVRRHRRSVVSGQRRPPSREYAQRRPGNPAVQQLAQNYNAYQGLPSIHDVDAKAQPETQRKIAAAYEALPVYDPNAIPAYMAFIKEVQQQYQFVLLNSDIEFDFTPGDPYPNSAAMMDDVRENHRLRVYTGGEPHPLMSPAVNEQFRAVHDLFGHAAFGNEFGKDGEMSAYAEHSQMFSPLARRAMFTETVGNNSVFNYGKDNEGKPVSQRKFAEQKAALLPVELQEEIDRNL